MRCDQAQRQQGRIPRGMPALLGMTFLAFINYAALLPVVPMWASHGGAGHLAVGATTGAMMAATVVMQVAMPRLLAALRLRSLMMIGLLLLGGPSPLYLLSTDFAPIMALTVLRGVGFAFVVTAGATLIATLARSGRLASSASWYGVAAALPNLGALAGGVWATQALGYQVVFWVAGAACAAALLLARSLPNHSGGRRSGFSPVSRRTGDLLVLFVLTAAAFGAVTTFLPLSGPTADLAAIALFSASVALVGGRLLAGYLGDRRGAGRLLPVAVGLSAIGLGLMALSLDGRPIALIIGATLLGAGFGASQNDSFVATVEQFGPDGRGTASAIWNACYDGGLGAGAVALGWVIGQLDYGPGFLIMAAAMLIIAVVILLSSWASRSTADD